MRVIHTYLLFCVFFCFSPMGYGQEYPIPAKDSRWGCVTMYGPPGLPGAGFYGDVENYSIKDTLIQNVNYQHWASVYSRYVANKLMILDISHSTSDTLIETVYYDFNLEVNDSFKIIKWNKYAVVKEVSTIQTLNGQTRKKIVLWSTDFTCINRLIWIEGIGDISNSVFYEWQLGTCDIYRRVVCFSDSSGDVYKENDFTFPCDSIDSYSELFEIPSTDYVVKNMLKQRIAYPNPFNKEIRIVISGLSPLKLVSLYNMAGMLVENSNKNVIQTETIKPGVYLLKIEFNEETIYKKMIKN